MSKNMSIPRDVSKIRSVLSVMNVEYEGQVENQLLEFTHRTFYVCVRVLSNTLPGFDVARTKTGHASTLLKRAQTYAHNAGRSVRTV